MRGRKPKPAAIRDLEGNPGKRPIPQQPKLPEGMPECPSHLSDSAREEWNRVAPELYRMGLLCLVDQSALAAYCQTWARWAEAERAIQKEGAVITAPSGYPIQSPHVGIANKALQQMRAFLAEFGMTPSARNRVQVNVQSPEQDDLTQLAAEILGEQRNRLVSSAFHE